MDDGDLAVPDDDEGHDVVFERHTLQIESGPLPSAEKLARYASLTPDAPERVLVMAEKEQAHKFDMDVRDSDITRHALDASIQRSNRGWLLGYSSCSLYWPFLHG